MNSLLGMATPTLQANAQEKLQKDMFNFYDTKYTEAGLPKGWALQGGLGPPRTTHLGGLNYRTTSGGSPSTVPFIGTAPQLLYGYGKIRNGRTR